MISKRIRPILMLIIAISLALCSPQTSLADTMDWSGVTWQYSLAQGPVYVNSAGNLVATGNGGVTTYGLSNQSLVGQELWITASFLTPDWGTCPALFIDGYTESGTGSRFHIGLMGSNGQEYGARHITHYNSTPYNSTILFDNRDPNDVGSEHFVGLFKPADGQSVELWFDNQIMAIINTTDPGGGDILASIQAISLGSFMPANRTLPFEFTSASLGETPEPATGLLLASAIGAIGLARRRRKRRETV